MLSFNEHTSTGFDCASGMPVRASAPYKQDKPLDHTDTTEHKEMHQMHVIKLSVR